MEKKITKVKTFHIDSNQAIDKLIPFASSSFFSTISSMQSTLSSLRSVIQSIGSTLNPILTPLTTNPLSTFYKQLLKVINDSLQSISSAGIKAIVIHPYNQAGKRTVNYQLNLLDVKDAIDYSVAELNYSKKKEYENKKTILEERISLLKQQLKETVEDAKKREKLNKQYIDTVKQLNALENSVEEKDKQFSSYTEKYINYINFSLPKLSFNDVIEELKQALVRSKKLDPNVPQWNSLTNVCGLGIVVSAKTPLEFINKLNEVNKLLQFQEIGKSIRKFRNELEKINSTLKDKGQKVKTEYEASKKNVISYFETVEKEDKKKRNKELLNKLAGELENYINTSLLDGLSTIGLADYPKWIGFSLDTISYLRVLQEMLMKFLNLFTPAIEATDNAIALIIKSLFAKINAISKYIQTVSDTLNILYSLNFSLTGLMFTINIDEKGLIEKGGGKDLLLRELSNLQNLNYIDDKQVYISLKESTFSALIFFGNGSINFDLIGKQFINIFKGFLNNFISPTAITNTTSLSIKINPDIHLAIIDKSSLSLSLTFSQSFKFYSLRLINTETSAVIKKIDKKEVISFTEIINFSNLEDKKVYLLQITLFGENSSYQKEYSWSFKTYFAFSNLNLNNGQVSNNSGESVVISQEGETTTPEIPISTGTTVPFDPSVEPNQNGYFIAYLFGLLNDIYKKKIYIYPFRDYLSITLKKIKTKKIYISQNPRFVQFEKEKTTQAIYFLEPEWGMFLLPYQCYLPEGIYKCLILENNKWEPYYFEVIYKVKAKIC